MNLDKIKSMIAQIKKDTGIQIIKGNTTHDKPPKPFAMYNITSPFIKGNGRGSIDSYSEGEITYEKLSEEYKTAISFTVYDDDLDIAMQKSHSLRKWFSFIGQHYLQDQDIALSFIGNVQNRTIFLADAYEYKYGFDIQIRRIDETIRTQEIIETINLGGN